MPHYLVFDDFDNPMYLKKVGNWVLTFLNSDSVDQRTRLAITYVLPRSVNQGIEIRRVVIEQTDLEHHWLIQNIDAFNGVHNQEIVLELDTPTTLTLLGRILKEFEKYDVCIQLKKVDV
jgi:hypothetical protein